MRKIGKTVLGSLLLAGLGTTYAGSMGPVLENRAVPFLSGEWSATWQEVNTASLTRIRLGNITNAQIPDNLNPWGFRIAGGIISPYKNNFLFSAETAWNYFGDGSTRSTPNDRIKAGVQIDGVDLLVGLFYQYQEKTKFFFKAGTLFQRVAFNVKTYGANGTVNGRFVTANGSTSGLQTTVMPELRTGLLYRIIDSWDFTVSYMHAFGSTPSAKVTTNTVGTETNISYNVNARNPTLNSVLIGLQYNFV